MSCDVTSDWTLWSVGQRFWTVQDPSRWEDDECRDVPCSNPHKRWMDLNNCLESKRPIPGNVLFETVDVEIGHGTGCRLLTRHPERYR